MLERIRHWWLRLWQWLQARLPSRRQKAPPEDAAIPVILQALPAHHGDSILLSYIGADEMPHHIWVDGGLVKSYHEVGKQKIRTLALKGENIDLMIVTHVDQDHIGGILALARDHEIRHARILRFWFNSGDLLSEHFNTQPDPGRRVALEGMGLGTRSIQQGIQLEDFLANHPGGPVRLVQVGQRYQLAGAHLDILSPGHRELVRLHREWQVEMQAETRGLTKNAETDHEQTIPYLVGLPEEEDTAIPNGSSIAFLFERAGKRILMLGDAHPRTLVASIKSLGYTRRKPLVVDLIKLSHHGSKGNISSDLLSLIRCQRYLISTDGSRHGLPHKEALARILVGKNRKKREPVTFYFNHDNPILRGIFTAAEMTEYQFRCVYPNQAEEGIWIHI